MIHRSITIHCTPNKRPHTQIPVITMKEFTDWPQINSMNVTARDNYWEISVEKKNNFHPLKNLSTRPTSTQSATKYNNNTS